MNTLKTSEQCINDQKSILYNNEIAQQCLKRQYIDGSQPTRPLFSVCLANERQQTLARMELAYLIDLDHQGCLVYANAALCLALGTCLDDMLGIHFVDLVFRSDRQEVIQALQSLEFPQARAQGVHRWNSPKGVIWVEWEAIATHNSDGKLKFIQIFAHDISEHKAKQAELEQRLRVAQTMADINRHLNEILEPKPILDLIVGYAQSLIQPAERAVLHRYDADKQLLLPTACAGLLESEPATLMMSPGIGIAGRAFAQRDLINVGDTSHDSRYLPGPGPQRFISLMAAPIQSVDQIIGTISVESRQAYAFQDDCERVLSELCNTAASALRNAYKFEHERVQHQAQIEKLDALGRTVSDLIHEINNPLQSIQNCLYVLKKENTSVPDASGFLNVALSEVERLSDLVTHLQLHKGDQITRVAPVNLGTLLDKIHTLVIAQLEQKSVNWVQGDIPPETMVLGDANQLTQVFLNLIINAIEAISVQGGTISLELQTIDTKCEVGLRIADSGPGVDPRLAKHIFDPFFTTKSTGTGLGLPVSYDIIRNHNGRITLDNRPGDGAAFTVWLPVADPEGGVLPNGKQHQYISGR